MKKCSACGEKIAADEGKLNSEGEFVCFSCAEELKDEKDKSVCPECEESSEEFEQDGLCPECGYEKESDEDEDVEDEV